MKLYDIAKMKKKIFPIGLGAMPLSMGNRPSLNDAIHIILHFIDRGGNFIDTANIYGKDSNHIGDNERLIAQALKKAKISNDIIIATKGGGTRPNNGWGLGAGHPKQLRTACENSLKALGRESIELYYLHGPDPKIPFADSVAALAQLKEEGKIQHIGIANVTQEQLTHAMTITEIAAVQNRCNTSCKKDISSGLVKYCQQNNIIYVPYCPLGGWNDHTRLAQSELYKDLQQKYKTSYYILCLAWLLKKGDHIIPIPGIDHIAQIDENLKSLSISLENEDIIQLDAFPELYRPTV